jgi:6-phosphogluconolactonase
MFLLNRSTDAPTGAKRLAAAVAQDLRTALTTQPRALLLVSGGRSPVAFFEELRGQPLAWERIDISLVDERSVGSDDSASNENLVRSTLLVGAASPARWISLMPKQCIDRSNDEWERAQYAAAIANDMADLSHPAVVVLGLGNDGHTASLFPDALEWPHAYDTQNRYVALQPLHAPHARVSLSLSALKHQPCYMWAFGADKAETLIQLAHVVEQVSVDLRSAASKQRLQQAGPAACLMAEPDMELKIYCSDLDAK